MKNIFPACYVPVTTTTITGLQKRIFISCCILPFLFYSQNSAAQFKQDVALQRSSISHPSPVEPIAAQHKSKATSVRSIMAGLKEKLLKNAANSNKAAPAQKIVLQADRVDEEQILIYWNAAAEGGNTTYIVERRLGDPHGPFDSVGTVTGRSTDPAAQAYRLVDKNSFKGNTFYRLRQPANDNAHSWVMVSNDRGLPVSAAPALAQTITIKLHQFKIAPRTHLYITDANGSLVYQKKNVFFSTASTIELTGIQLPKGHYSIEVSNHYNTGVSTLVIR